MVEVVVVNGTGKVDPSRSEPSWRWVAAREPGLAAAAIAGLREARGDVLLVLDSAMGYVPADLSRVVEPIARGEADLAVASRFAGGAAAGPTTKLGWLRRCAGVLVRPLTGTSDPFTGLIGLTRDLFVNLADTLRPLGTKFGVEILARAGGRWIDIAVGAGWPAQRSGLEIDDFRQLKRLADHRFGNFSRLVQFCVVGASGMAIDLTSYAGLNWLLSHTWMAHRTAPVVGAPLGLTVARALAIWLALTSNFLLNRRLAFSYARQGSIVRQYLSYALSNLLGIALSFTLSLKLPQYVPFFDAHKLAAAVVGIVAATAISFSMSRWVVFKHRSQPRSVTVAR